MRFRLRHFAGISLCVALAHTSACAQEGGYYSGGAEPFPAKLQATLDSHAPILTLGINHDWLKGALIDPALFVEAIDVTADAVEAGKIPGAQVYANRLAQEMLPVGVGYLMTDPQKHPVENDSLYYIQDLQGPLITVPLLMQLVSVGQLQYEQTLGDLVPAFAGTDKERITLEMLLRHSSGFPASYEPASPVKSREDVIEALKKMPLEQRPGAAVKKSPLNFMVAGFVLEEIYKQPYSTIVKDRAFQLLQVSNAAVDGLDDQRQLIAPNHYSDWLGRLQWAEPDEPLAFALSANAGSVGLVASCDQVSTIGGALLLIESFNVSAEGKPLSAIGRAFLPDPEVPGAGAMGLGFELGKYGPRSFGWDSPKGSSFWVLPEKKGYIVYLSNADHPNGVPKDFEDPREQVLTLLAKSLKPLPPPTPAVDTKATPGESVQGTKAPERN